jgi:circadian clock protein KaiB
MGSNYRATTTSAVLIDRPGWAQTKESFGSPGLLVARFALRDDIEDRRVLRRSEEAILSKYLLKLYVTGKTARSERAIANLKRVCEEELSSEYELQIIDVLENPQMAEDDRILATPTLIKQLPPPLRRIIGDLSDKEKVLFGLEVRPDPNQSGK